jgi:glycosyl transferase family 25
MIRELEKTRISYEFVTGVDERNPEMLDVNTVDPTLKERPRFPPGVVGCALSHLLVYQTILAEGLPQALVLEDDVTLPADLDILLDALAEHLTGAELALLNYYSATERNGGVVATPCRLMTQGSVPLARSWRLMSPADVFQLTSAAAYVITREACKRMASAVLPVRARADEWGYFQETCALDRVRCVAPRPVRVDLSFHSTIQYYASNSVHGRLRKLVRFPIPLLYQLAAFRRARIDKRWERIEYVDDNR